MKAPKNITLLNNKLGFSVTHFNKFYPPLLKIFLYGKFLPPKMSLIEM